MELTTLEIGGPVDRLSFNSGRKLVINRNTEFREHFRPDR